MSIRPMFAPSTALLASFLIASPTIPSRPANAAFVDLVSGNSQARVDDRNGLTVWRVNGGADNVFLSNDYLRVGPSGNESPLLVALGTPTLAASGANQVSLTYDNGSLRAVVAYTLVGGTPGMIDSSILKTTTLTNLGPNALDIHLFQYSDFDLQFDQANQLDQVRLLGPSALLQTRSGTDHGLLTTVDVAPSHYQVVDNFFDLYTKFFVDQDGPTTLNDTPTFGTTFPDPPRDAAFALQWDRTLGAGQTFAVGGQFRIFAVPEPTSLALSGLGGLMAWGASRRLRRRA